MADEVIEDAAADEAAAVDQDEAPAEEDADAAAEGEAEQEPEATPEPEPAAEDTPVAPLWEVVGADGRRIERWLPEPEAKAFANRLGAQTGEKVKARRQK